MVKSKCKSKKEQNSEKKEQNIEKEIYELFSRATKTLGYSEIHGRIIAALLVEGCELSLQDLSKKTGYSPAALSLSLDLLELFGIIKKVKIAGDRKLYVKLEGDLLSALKFAILTKAQKAIENAFEELEQYRNIENEKTRRTIIRLEAELRRLQKYIQALANVEIPEE
jgi:DNA-binding transcriptional regulator GbsR (MarR family)